MRTNLLQDKHSRSRRKLIFVEVICLAIVAMLSFGLCYAYFSGSVTLSGTPRMGVLEVMYCKNSTDTTGSAAIYGSINNGTASDLSTIRYVAPGEKLAIKGYAVNSSNIDVFVLGRLEVVATTPNGNTETEVVWYNISNGQELYVEQGRFQVGASVLYANGGTGDRQEINASYTFDGDKYTNGYSITSVKFELLGHQAEHLDFASDMDLDTRYNSYITKSGGKNVYNDNSKKLVCHYITGRMLDVWKTSDANANGVLGDLSVDSSGAYLINNCAEWMIFKKVAQTQSNTQNKKFKLNCYLDFNNTTTAINVATFYGEFDGNGYTLSNINASIGQGSWGIFGTTHNATISNLGVDGLKVNFTASGSTGAKIGGIVGSQNQGTTSNCFVIGASVYNSSVTYDISVPNTVTTDCYVGGIVGNLLGDNSTSTASALVANCYAVLNISASGGYNGGIVGREYPSLCKIDKCYFSGKIGSAKYSAGICGEVSTSSVENCYGIFEEFVTTNTSSNNGLVNCAYQKNGTISKLGVNQTTEEVNQSTFKSVGKLRDAFGWDTTVWADDIYHSTQGLPVLRVFYNF